MKSVKTPASQRAASVSVSRADCKNGEVTALLMYNPLGLASPALVAGKILLGRLYGPTTITDWDQDIPKVEKQRLASWFGTLLDPVEAIFPRSMHPMGAQGEPRMVGFCNSANLGMCAVIYIVWLVSMSVNESRIMLGKCLVTPLVGMLIP